MRKKPCSKPDDVRSGDGDSESPCYRCKRMCGEQRAKAVCFSRKEERLKKMIPLELEQWNSEFALALKSLKPWLRAQDSVTLEFEGVQRQEHSQDIVAVMFDRSLSTPIFNMGELMSVIDQIGKTVTITSPKEDDTVEESNFLEQASSCVGLFGFIKAFTGISYESGARGFGLGRIIATYLLDVLVQEYAKRMEVLLLEVYKWLMTSTRSRKQFDIAVVVLGVVLRLVVEQCNLPSEDIWGWLKCQGVKAKPWIEAFGNDALPLIDPTPLPSETFSDFAKSVLPILPNCFQIIIKDTRSFARGIINKQSREYSDRITLGALLVYEAPEAYLGGTVQPTLERYERYDALSSTVQPTLEGYNIEQRASETIPSTENSLDTCAYVSSGYSNHNFEENWLVVHEGRTRHAY
ncbi:hypothetical protein GP486_001805 [Trichoglossum hirsutum]|uniref:Uncharacterized protein n=1 Tax=Trichoglossum hirsutum TaxID=265104 RepID=A0A9P8LGB2_9PEZI|nr:hypothetical protein GP486_001805 [Trichoglossum hirsutum]